ncbi:hypothetical protein M422DRAFT_147022, partial [Sphaerobolus stellatus SS14]
SQTTESIKIFPFSLVIGFLSLVIGMLIHLVCYHAMGKHFTFQITIRPNHQLIDTG